MNVPHRPDSRLRSSMRLALAICLLAATACSQPASEPPPDHEATKPPASAATDAATDVPGNARETIPVEITAANVLENERFWPDIVALVEPFSPEGGATTLKQGFRGALMRVEDDLRVRIAFGRHGNHTVPLDETDLLTRANEIRLGGRHKLGPNFVVHFGAQFVDPESAALAPYPTPRLQEADRFLCVFADPRGPELAKAVKALAAIEDLPGMRSVFFPLGLPAGELGVVRDALVGADWLVPFAYPGGADIQARSLLGDEVATPVVLLLSAEGRVLLRSPLDAADLADRIRSAAEPPTDVPPAP